MKKALHITVLLLLVCLFCSCSLLTPPEDTTGGGPTLAEVDAGIRAATPTECRVTIGAAYTSPSVTLSASLHLKVNGDAEYYTYEADRLLSTEEALAAGVTTQAVTGHLHLVGNETVSASDEVDAALLAGVSSLTLHLPHLTEENLSEMTITKSGSGYLLSATVKDERLADMLDSAANLSGLSFTITLTDALVPSALTADWTSPLGATVHYEATYSYTPVSIP